MIRTALAVICLVFLASVAHAQDATPEMKTDFLGKVKAAIAQKDFKAFCSLYSRQGTVDPALKDKLDKGNQDLFNTISTMASPDYAFAAPAANQLTSFTYQGKSYETNLKVLLVLQIHDLNAPPNTASGTWSIPLGIDNGVLMITETVLIP
jgi:hypothetical protein